MRPVTGMVAGSVWLLMMFAGLPAWAAADGWVNATSNLANLPSECGNLTLLSAVPESNTVIAGVAKQGLWASTDGGATFQALGSGPGSAAITNRPSWISFDPLDASRFYESGIYNGGGAFRTADGGTTFSQLEGVEHNDFVSVDYTDPDRKTLLLGAHERSRTVWKSTDAGKTWANIGATLPPDTGFSTYPLIVDARTYLVNADRSWAGGSPGIFRTTDAGMTWSQVFSFGPSGAPLTTSDGTVYWPVGDTLAKSSDHGVSWSRVGEGLVGGVHPIEVPGGRLVSARPRSVVVSSDGGATWEQIGPPLPFTPAGVVYSEGQKALFIWRGDCGNRVPADGVQKLSYDFGPATVPPIRVATPPPEDVAPPPDMDMPPPATEEPQETQPPEEPAEPGTDESAETG